MASFSTECILEDLKSAQFIEDRNEIRVQSQQFEPPEAILSLLNRGHENPYLVPPHILSQTANYAHQYRFTTIFRLIAEYSLKRVDAERAAHPDVSSDTAALLTKLIILCSHDLAAYGDLVLRLMDILLRDEAEASDTSRHLIIKELPAVAQLGITRVLLDHPDMPRFLPILDILVPSVLEQTPNRRSSGDSSGVGTWTLYRLVIGLMEHGLRPKALELFRHLMEHERFPTAATVGMEIIDSSELGEIPSAFDAIMLMSIARACQLFGWSERNLRVIRILADRCEESTSVPESDMVSRILHHSLMDLIAEGAETSLANAVSLFKQCIRSHYIQPPSRHILDQLYTALHQKNMSSSIYELFQCVRGGSKARAVKLPGIFRDGADQRDQKWRYAWPPYRAPKGEACVALLRYLVDDLKMPRLVRSLAHHHADHPLELNDQHHFVPKFLTLYTESGFIDEAVRIWRAYRHERGAEMVVGNAKSTIAMVKALMTQSNPRSARRHNREVRNGAKRNHDWNIQHAPSIMDVDIDSAENRQEQCKALAYEIANDYTSLNQPLNMAAHSTLTSIANVNFLIGNLPMALGALAAVLERNTIPDGHDLAVTLSGVAKYDPVQAARAIENAVGRGVQVPKHAWTAVLKEALMRQDFELAETLLRGLMAAGITVDAKVIDTVVRHGLNFSGASQNDIRTFLERSLESLTRSSKVLPSLAGVCIRRALSAGLPDIAFKFWDVLLRNHSREEEFLDQHFVDRDASLRHAIANALATAIIEGHATFSKAQASKMCDHLDAKHIWRRRFDRRSQ